MEILVVEDEAGIADFLERGLESEGYGVTVAEDGVAELLQMDADLIAPAGRQGEKTRCLMLPGAEFGPHGDALRYIVSCIA